ncbi:MAG: DUF1566 domain-containing protein [Candidatus Electrothrix sp. ATG1]|nr:DUF1566 domain-containing protein [Candidatus Electrothrix sp. ATG1]
MKLWMIVHPARLFCRLTGRLPTIQLSISPTTPSSQLIDNNDGTVIDLETGLMWKKCLEGFSGDLCLSGILAYYNWHQALKVPAEVDNGAGFANYHDWRYPIFGS